MQLIDPNTLPYRPCVGIVVLNPEARIWIGHRCDELIGAEKSSRWQMPQGGIDKDEDPRLAATRELYEETGIKSIEIATETKDWIPYDLPPDAIGKAMKGKYRGQRQKWFAMHFLGSEDEINLMPDGHPAEFDAWRWATPEEVLEEIVWFKRGAYEAVFAEFRHLFSR
jgi:putative (di)nucleoside polyphosphate hydrolase